MGNKYVKRKYIISESITFRKTNEEYGGLSNMAGGYPIYFNDMKILTAEALYQACRFPDYPDVQYEIIAQRSPMTAKDISRRYNNLTRQDWMEKRVAIMNWCIHLKLLYNWNKFGRLLVKTGSKEIVELSSKDDFWGAYEKGNFAEGYNVLGILLKYLRKIHNDNLDKQNITLSPPNVNNFNLFNIRIDHLKIDVTKNYHIEKNFNLFDDYDF